MPAEIVRKTEPIKSVDIMPSITKYPADQRKVLFGGLLAIQLTHGCSSGCRDCVLEVKHGVDHQISYLSFNEMMATYKDELPDEITLHYGSDPLDYKDGQYGITDIYKSYKKHKPDSIINLSTHFPKGGEESLSQIAAEMIKVSVDQDKKPEHISISLRQTNKSARIEERKKIVERVEQVKARVKQLLPDGKYQRRLFEFFEYIDYSEGLRGLTVVSDIYRTRLPLGRAFLRSTLPFKDKMQSEVSVTSADGVILSPDGFSATAMDALSIFNRTGETSWDILPGEGFESPVPRGQGFATDFDLVAVYHDVYKSMPPILLPQLEVLKQEGKYIEQQTRHRFSRDVRTFRTLLQTFSRSSNLLKRKSIDFVFALYEKIKDEYSARREIIQRNSESANLDRTERFYLEPVGLYVKLFDHLLSEIDRRRGEGTIDARDLIDLFSNAYALKSRDIKRLKIVTPVA